MKQPPIDKRTRATADPRTGEEPPGDHTSPLTGTRPGHPRRPTDDTVRRIARAALRTGADTATPGAAHRHESPTATSDTSATTPSATATPARIPRADDGPRVRPVAEGGEHWSWWVGARHVLRMAPDREVSARLRREIRLRDLVRRHVAVPVPVSAATGIWAEAHVYTLDQRLFGESGEDVSVSAVGEPDLAALLTGLHEVPVADAVALGVPRTPPRSLDDLRTAARHAARQLLPDREFDAGKLARLTPRAVVELAPRAAAVVVHGDLKGEHLRISADGRVRGVLDWADALIGDPAEDIRGLALSVGAPAAVRAATLAGYSPRECLRGLWLARCDTLILLAERLHGTDDSPLPLLRSQLARAWEAILLERLSEDDG
ncbi:aminoglycoside phosphotransferase family protein [Streptomyces uncialis]|uniref:aminoglycoside phosphotransferase family protein n=1 Tax=Streptomyces uncialis TaxID=1048205 RepID=UPI003868BEB0|nr:aminoglycoside phosphotransferase family protein [Streptomyces uncialis]